MDKECSSCGQKDRCQEIYDKMGRVKGPNIAFKAILAFVVPVAAFVIAAGFAQPWLKAKLDNATLVIVCQVAVGLIAATAAVYIASQFTRKQLSGEPKCPQKDSLNKE